MSEVLPAQTGVARLSDAMHAVAGWSAVALLFAAPTSRALFNLAALLLLLGIALGGRYRARWAAVRDNPVTLPALLMYGVIVFGAVHTSASWVEVQDHWERYSKFLLLPLLLSVFGQTVWRERAWNAFLAAMLIVLGSTYANIWWDLPWSITAHAGWGQDHSVFANHIAQGLAMSFFVAVCLLRGAAQASLARRWGWWLLALLAAVSVTHLSQGRGGQIALVCALLVLVARRCPPRWRWWAVAGAASAIVLLFMSSPLLQKRFGATLAEVTAYEQGSSYTSAGARLHMWRTSIELIKEAPVLGHGTGAYHGQSARLFADDLMCEIGCFHPHNQLLFFGVDHGLVGMALFLFFLWRPLRHALQDNGNHRVLLSVFMAVLLVDVFFHGPLWIHMEAYFFFTMLALLMGGEGLQRAPAAPAEASTRSMS